MDSQVKDEKYDNEKEGSLRSVEKIDSEAIDAFGFENKGIAYTDIIEAAEHLTLEEAKRIIHEAIDNNKYDPNFDQSLLKRATNALAEESLLSHDAAKSLAEEIKLEAALFNDSPYVEVRAAISNTDDTALPVDTFRAWFLGLAFTIVGTSLNTFFAARQPAIVLNSFCAQVLCFPMAKAMEYLPTRKFRIFGNECSLNPGPFNQKEHMLITIMSNVSYGGIGVYLTDLFFVQRLPMFFNQDVAGANAGYQILLTLSTQLIGFSLAGLSRRFLVYPPAMIWPGNLATVVLNKSLHEDTNLSANGWRISRLKFFLWLFLRCGIYFLENAQQELRLQHIRC